MVDYLLNIRSELRTQTDSEKKLMLGGYKIIVKSSAKFVSEHYTSFRTIRLFLSNDSKNFEQPYLKTKNRKNRRIDSSFVSDYCATLHIAIFCISLTRNDPIKKMLFVKHQKLSFIF